ncbi:MAG: helix-turn-helix transcriptional regulator [Bacteroidetes bacterium]|nr:helix-turn-helix transcriptional regulator [Bacteroidota bacterium]
MNRIKEFRKVFNMTQKDLAKKLNTSQQTIARWETGKVEPSIANLRDLAFILHTSVDYIIGRTSTTPKISLPFYSINNPIDPELDGLWENLGLKPTNSDKTFWYPITNQIQETVHSCAQNSHWFSIDTLNNKIVCINPKGINRFVLLDEAADEFPHDWQVAWHEHGCYPPVLYEVLELIQNEEDGIITLPDEAKISSELIDFGKEIILDNSLEPDDINQITTMIKIFFKDGSIESYYVSEYETFADFIFYLSCETLPETLYIPTDEFNIYLPLESIAILEIPLLKVNLAQKLEELDLLDKDE